MKRIDLRQKTETDILALLTKPDFDEVTVSEKTRARIRRTFGADLSPHELVGQIVQDVRKKGDVAVLEYTAKIDLVFLTAAQL